MILVINSGSSSIKYKLFDETAEKMLARGMVDRIGLPGSAIADHHDAIRRILNELAGNNGSALKEISQISAIGHRVVHGGERFADSVLVDSDVIKGIKSFLRLAPLHNPPNLLGIEACRKLLPKTPQVAVFDTAYYHTLPDAHCIYALPYELYEKEGIRRYGFHGTSHKYVAIKTARLLKKPLSAIKIITCHLGNGCSITATKNGKAIDTSMGFTPLEGLVMGTRSGDIDPIILLYLIEKKKMTPADVDTLVNKKSGLLGVSGIGSDMRDVYKAHKGGNKRATLAFDIFVRGIQKYIGAYAVAMDGVDAIVFTAGIGENHPPTRQAVCDNLRFMGIAIDSAKNAKNACFISKPKSRVKVLVVPTDEELMIAQETAQVVGR